MHNNRAQGVGGTYELLVVLQFESHDQKRDFLHDDDDGLAMGGV